MTETTTFHLRRLWPERHDPTPCTLVGHEHLTRGDLARASLRQLIAILKRARIIGISSTIRPKEEP